MMKLPNLSAAMAAPLTALALLSACSEEPAAPSGEATISAEALSANIRTLASDEFGGRAPASEGEELTVAFMTKAFRGLGLEPANGDSYSQPVPLVSIEAGQDTKLSVKAGGATIDLAYGTSQVTWTRQVIDSIAVSDSEMVFVGYGINAPERGWNDYDGIDVTGKTVVMLINDPGYATQDPALFNGNAMTYYGRWDYKFDEAAAQGAAGAIIIHDTQPAAYPWSTVENSWTGPQFSLVRPDGGAALAKFEAWISNDSARLMMSAAGQDLDALMEAAKTPGFRAVPLSLTASSALTNKTSRINSRNVAAILPGKSRPDEVFIYMAHWDHLGTKMNAAEGEDAIYNGALDNATGTAGLIELARAYTSLPERPDRSVMFLAVTAEEQGLLGSAWYASNPLVPLASTVGGINMDGLNNFGPTRDVTVVGLGNSELDKYLEGALREGRRLRPDAFPEKGYFYRSDHFELAREGVPMLYPGSGIDHKEKGEAYGIEREKDYTGKHYHGPSDEWSPDWDLSGAVEDLQLYFRTGLALVNSNDWPNWSEGTEFKAKRDAQRQSAVQPEADPQPQPTEKSE